MIISFSSPPACCGGYRSTCHYSYCACVKYKMALVNACVYSSSERKTVLPWTIRSVDPPDSTFRRFYQDDISLLASQAENYDLQEAFVGSRKDSLDKVDCDLIMKDVTATFGPFVKFVVTIRKKPSFSRELLSSMY